MLFAVRGVELVVLPESGLDAGQSAIIEAILKQMQAEGVANYYGAVAVSPAFFDMLAQNPGAAALSGLLQISERFHNIAAAGAASLEACDKARTSGQAKCVVAAEVLPRKWSAQPLQLSVSATEAFREYRKRKAPKALAISPMTTAFGIGFGEAANGTALARCNRAAKALGQADCEIVIED